MSGRARQGVLAILLTLAVAALGCRSGETSERAPLSPLTAIEPSAATAWPFEFRWSGADEGTVVRVHVLDEAERPVYGIEARGDHVAAPAALETLLQPGTRYQWRVSRVDQNGEESGVSALTGFTIQP